MKVDFRHKFTNLDGKEIAADGGKCTTMADVCVSVLTGEVGKASKIPEIESVRRYQLAVRIHDAKEPLELKAEEVVMLKKLVADNYIPLLVAPALEILEPPPVVEEVAPQKPKGKTNSK